MTDETPEVASPAEEVAPASETPQEQPPMGQDVSSADYQADQNERFKTLEDNIVDRMKKSQTAVLEDRVSKEVGGALSGFDEVVEALRPHLPENFDATDIKRQQWIDNQMAQSTPSEPELELEAPPQAEAPTPASVPPGRETEIAQILEQHGLSGSEPELTEYAEANKDKPWFQVGQGFADLAESLKARQSGNPAGVVTPQGQVSNPDLVEAFRKELSEAIGQGQYGMNTLRNLQSKYVEQGVPLEDLDISNRGKADTDMHGFPIRA